MLRRSRWLFMVAAAVVILLIPCADQLYAQGTSGAAIARPGGYLSWVKLLSIAVVFLAWVRMADWLNRDAMKIGDKTKMAPEFWNPMIVFSFLIGFLLAISVPIFLAGFPIYVLTAFLPIMLYAIQRRGKLKQNPSIARQLSAAPGEVPPPEALPQDQGAQVDFSPAGASANDRQSNLIRARQTNGFNVLKDLIIQAQFKRSEQILMDYTRESVSLRILVDGAWHALEPMDRPTGDAVLASLKHLAGLNPAERRAQQVGQFAIKSELGKSQMELTSRGVPTGERAQLKFIRAAQEILPLDQLGMFPDMVTQIRSSLNQPGMTIVSAPPATGMTTSWQGALFTADRLTRDCVGLIDEDETETVVENIVIHRYDQNTPDKDQLSVLSAMLLTQPDMIAVPKIENSDVLDLLAKQVLTQERSVLLLTPAKSAAEALLRVYAQAGDREQFLKALNNVTCQRLVRRLCDQCKVEVQVQPQVIKQLGGDPRTQTTIFNQWTLPPPEQRVDEKGNPIEFPPCEACGGIGFIGRIGVFEMLTLNDQLRQFIKKNPKVAPLEQAATKLGKRSLAQQAYQLVLLGVTSLAEVQRVLKEQP